MWNCRFRDSFSKDVESNVIYVVRLLWYIILFIICSRVFSIVSPQSNFVFPFVCRCCFPIFQANRCSFYSNRRWLSLNRLRTKLRWCCCCVQCSCAWSYSTHWSKMRILIRLRQLAKNLLFCLFVFIRIMLHCLKSLRTIWRLGSGV